MATRFPGGALGRTLAGTLLLLEASIALAGLWVGSALIEDPTGASLGLGVGLLEGTPFTDFALPGLLVFAADGLLPALGVLAIVLVPRFAPPVITASGLLVIGSALAGGVLLAVQPWVQPLVLAAGVATLTLGATWWVVAHSSRDPALPARLRHL